MSFLPRRAARHFLCLIFYIFTLLAIPKTAQAIYIDLNYSAATAPAYIDVFERVAEFWGETLIGYQPSIDASILGDVVINASVENIDGPGQILGYAGPTWGVNTGGYFLAAEGVMVFDNNDVADLLAAGALESVILHEMAHVLGFGTLWELNGVYVPNSGQYTGPNALAVWQREFGQHDATYIPVELGGGAGTANGHWDEPYGGGSMSGIVDDNGNDLTYELMTGWLNNPDFISETTLASFSDIGYEVATVPILAGMYLFLSGLAGLGLMRGRNPGC